MSKRTITFEPWTEENSNSLVNFVVLYNAFMGTADNPNRSRSLEETKQALKVLDAFDAISDVSNPGQPGEGRQLKKSGGDLVLDEASWQLMQRSVDAYVGTVPFAMAKLAMTLKEQVDNAKQA